MAYVFWLSIGRTTWALLLLLLCMADEWLPYLWLLFEEYYWDWRWVSWVAIVIEDDVGFYDNLLTQIDVWCLWCLVVVG